MIHDLVAETDVATCVVYDPDAVSHLATLDWSGVTGDLGDREAVAGNLVLLDTGSDGKFKFRAYVDEAAPAELLGRAFHEERGGLLRVPSGRLRSSGMEHLPFKGAGPVPGFGTEIAIPPGDYRVDAFLVGPGENDERELPVDRVTGCGCASTVVLLPLALLFLGANHWHFDASAAAVIALLVAFWIPVIVWHRRPSVRAAKARLAGESTPSLVLVMQRLAGDADRAGMKGIALRPPGRRKGATT